jgi:hypothetical protein
VFVWILPLLGTADLLCLAGVNHVLRRWVDAYVRGLRHSPSLSADTLSLSAYTQRVGERTLPLALWMICWLYGNSWGYVEHLIEEATSMTQFHWLRQQGLYPPNLWRVLHAENHVFDALYRHYRAQRDVTMEWLGTAIAHDGLAAWPDDAICRLYMEFIVPCNLAPLLTHLEHRVLLPPLRSPAHAALDDFPISLHERHKRLGRTKNLDWHTCWTRAFLCGAAESVRWLERVTSRGHGTSYTRVNLQALVNKNNSLRFIQEICLDVLPYVLRDDIGWLKLNAKQIERYDIAKWLEGARRYVRHGTLFFH